MPLQMLIVSDSELTRPPWTRCCPAERRCRSRGSCQSAPAEGCSDPARTWSHCIGLVTGIQIISDSVIYDIDISEYSAPSTNPCHAQCHAMLLSGDLPGNSVFNLRSQHHHDPVPAELLGRHQGQGQGEDHQGGQGHLQNLCDQHL